jgi:hypothetical protein
MRLFLACTAILSWVFGAALLLAPEAFYAPIGISMTPMHAVIAEAHGATVVGLGLVNWLARDAAPETCRAVLAGNVLANVLSLAVVVHTMWLGAGGRAAPALFLHAVLLALFAYFFAVAWRAK